MYSSNAVMNSVRSVKFQVFLLSIAVAAVKTSFVPEQTGRFWQLTDMHYDSEYDRQPFMTGRQCQSFEGIRNISGWRRGYFGDYNCGSPWSLIQSAIWSMKEIEPNPDFILWTGDTIGYIAPDTKMDQEKVFDTLFKVTDYMRTRHRGTPIFPLLGNHDSWPANLLPVMADDSFYSLLLRDAGWDLLIKSRPQINTFKIGGYYSAPLSDRLRLVATNSNLWYKSNSIRENVTSDPCNQFQWLEKELQEARRQNEQILLAGHVPPGVFGRAGDKSWMRPEFNKRFLELLQQYHDVIIAALFGHEHTDSFRVVYNSSTGEPLIPMFIAPSLTPWRNVLPGVGSNNPAMRLYTYSKHNDSTSSPTKRRSSPQDDVPCAQFIVDYTQYYANLSASNDAGRLTWLPEYRATEALAVRQLDADSLNDTLWAFMADEQSSTFDRYYLHNSVSLGGERCDGRCKMQHVCAAAEIELERYVDCLTDPRWRPRRRRQNGAQRLPLFSRDYSSYAGFLVVVVVAVVVVCRRRCGGRMKSRGSFMISSYADEIPVKTVLVKQA